MRLTPELVKVAHVILGLKQGEKLMVDKGPDGKVHWKFLENILADEEQPKKDVSILGIAP